MPEDPVKPAISQPDGLREVPEWRDKATRHGGQRAAKYAAWGGFPDEAIPHLND